VFLDDAHRDDPDAILEGWSAMYHIDRTSLDWTVSDILSGEDGTVGFDGDTALYDNLSMSIGQPPFTAIRVEMSAKWAQSLVEWHHPPGALAHHRPSPARRCIPTGRSPASSPGGGYYVRDSGLNNVNGVIGSTTQHLQFQIPQPVEGARRRRHDVDHAELLDAEFRRQHVPPQMVDPDESRIRPTPGLIGPELFQRRL
jgi:hypothetical protein